MMESEKIFMPADPLAPVAAICQRHGVTQTPAEFQAAVNVAFHRYESEKYDELHTEMWESLPAQINLLANDCLKAGAPERIRALDIGCGTGLASDCLVRSPLGARIESLDLLDTSSAMLGRAQARRNTWGKPGEAIEGLIETIAQRSKRYNFIFTSSVLHHVPDLASFLKSVAALQEGESPAFFLHLQDPNGDHLKDPDLMQRMGTTASSQVPEWLARLDPRRVAARLVREFKGEQGQDYISKTNQELIEHGFLNSPLSVAEIFEITDIHAQEGEGISIQEVGNLLPDYRNVSCRSYGFFGKLWSELPPAQKKQEEEWIQQGAQNGFHVEALWQRL